MEEQKDVAVATPAKPKKLKYEELPYNAVIVFEVTTQTTKIEDNAVELAPVKLEKSAAKAFWDGLESWPKGHSKAGQKKDINEGLKAPKLIGYYDAQTKTVVKF